MIVDNSAQQPDNIGHRYISSTNGDSLSSVSADSTAYVLCMSLGRAIAESSLFHDVRICEDTLRRDSLFYNTKPFNSADVKSFCDDYRVDDLITLDKLFFKTVFNENINNDPSDNRISAEISGELRLLWPEQKEAYTIPFTDSLTWHLNGMMYLVVNAVSKSNVRSAMLYLSNFVGYEMHTNFVPHWSNDARWYYTNFSSEWKTGSVYAAAKKWTEAAEVWVPLYEKVTQWKQKARLSSNIALCNEMIGDFEKAVEYAEISHNLFKENDKKNSQYIRMQDIYVNALKKRKSNDEILSKQLRETK